MRKMKDSGIEWIGDIPEGWEVRKVKNIAVQKTVQNHPNEEVLSLYRDWGVVIKSSRNDNFNRTSENTENYKFVEVGDIVINKMKAWQGSIAVSFYQGIVSPAYYVFKIISKNVYGTFLHYLLRSSCYYPEYRRLSGGIRPNQWDLDVVAFKQIPVLIPPLPEQQRITDYLDAKCARIDESAELIRQSMEKLRAYKLSLITEAVTKGLDPNVPMKDSGIPWIGEIPAGWEVMRLRFLCSICTGDKDTINKNPDGKYPFFVRSQQVEKIDTFSFDGEAILMAGDGADAGKIFHHMIGKFDYHQRVYNIHNFSKNLIVRFVFYYLQVNFIKKIEEATAKSTVDSVRLPMLLNFPIAFPPLSEQQRIADYLDARCARIDALLEEKERLLERLAEYKKSLIFECVTGKREVSA